jgi:hypothetical protein
MLRLEFRWWIWVVLLLIVFMVYKGPSTMAWAGGAVLRGFAEVGTALVRGLNDVKNCGSRCHAG